MKEIPDVAYIKKVLSNKGEDSAIKYLAYKNLILEMLDYVREKVLLELEFSPVWLLKQTDLDILSNLKPSKKQMIIQETKSMSVQEELTIDDLVRMLHKVQSVMTKVMVINEDYGKLPGTSKPSLLLPGAQKLNMMFRFSPVYDWKEEKLEANHRNYLVSCDLIHIITGKLVARGLGSCSTLESKYRYRTGGIVCPDCGNDSISKGKGDESWNKNFYCNTKKGACNAKFPLTDERLVSQPVGKTENKDIADCWNTVLKMACKRALIAATINATGASCIFTQD